jgi:hypothetical protein
VKAGTLSPSKGTGFALGRLVVGTYLGSPWRFIARKQRHPERIGSIVTLAVPGLTLCIGWLDQ